MPVRAKILMVHIGLVCFLIGAALAEEVRTKALDPLKATLVLPNIDEEPAEALVKIANLAPVLVNVELIRPPGKSKSSGKARVKVPAGSYSMGTLLLEIGKCVPGFSWQVEGEAVVLVLREDEKARAVLETTVKAAKRFSGTFDDLISWLVVTRHDLGLGFSIPNMATLKSAHKIQMDIPQDATFRSILTKAGEKAGLRWMATVPDKPVEQGYFTKDEQGRLVKHPGSTTGYIIRFDLFRWQSAATKQPAPTPAAPPAQSATERR